MLPSPSGSGITPVSSSARFDNHSSSAQRIAIDELALPPPVQVPSVTG
jgi:hypothetical protein